MKKIQEVRGFIAFLLHPPNGYLQPICTLVLALSVMSVGGSIAREAQNREMCARRLAYGQEAMATPRFAQFKKLAARIGVTDEANQFAAVRAFCRWYE